VRPAAFSFRSTTYLCLEGLVQAQGVSRHDLRHKKSRNTKNKKKFRAGPVDFIAKKWLPTFFNGTQPRASLYRDFTHSRNVARSRADGQKASNETTMNETKEKGVAFESCRRPKTACDRRRRKRTFDERPLARY
jgi:hypothetical protein